MSNKDIQEALTREILNNYPKISISNRCKAFFEEKWGIKENIIVNGQESVVFFVDYYANIFPTPPSDHEESLMLNGLVLYSMISWFRDCDFENKQKNVDILIQYIKLCLSLNYSQLMFKATIYLLVLLVYFPKDIDVLSYISRYFVTNGDNDNLIIRIITLLISLRGSYYDILVKSPSLALSAFIQ